MDQIDSQDAFMNWVIHFLAQKFPDHAILKGGMVLKLIGCARSTNDIDYVFVPYKSKKDVLPLIQGEFSRFPQVKLNYRFHSTNLRIILELQNKNGTFKSQLEVSVEMGVPTEPISSGDYAIHFNNSPQIIQVMRFDVAMAHKLAAWNERELWRDLYDAYFMYDTLQVLPHRETLTKRLQKINYTRRVKGKNHPTKLSLKQFCTKLKNDLRVMTQKSLEDELEPLFEKKFLLGIDKKIKTKLTMLVEELRLI